MKKLSKAAMITDLHLGRRSNSEDHNTDCMNFIQWFCEEVKKDKKIDHVYFLGDWHEHRSSINGQTLDFSYKCAKLLNELEIPVFMMIGNHDLYYRHSRKIYTTNPFDALSNIILVDEPIILDETVNKVLLCPYLFHHEYPSLSMYSDVPIFIGHFEFAGFVVTGDHNTLKHGPDHNLLKDKKRIFSGHFHKRQKAGNVLYIGNTFPMDFSDANDTERGMTIYDFKSDVVSHKAWPNAPVYISCKLSDIMDENSILINGARVNCIVDVDITYSESIEIKTVLTSEFNLKEFFFFEESAEIKNVLENTEVDESSLNTETTIQLVKSLILQIETNNIDKELLVEIFEGKK